MDIRYSDADLVEFKALVDKKMAMAQRQVKDLEDQLQDTTENSEDDFGTDMIDDSTFGSQVEFLTDMLIRQRKHVISLENAMRRIENKTYGICVISGELIDKRRLLAVPTTTKSLKAKTEPIVKTKKVADDEEEDRPKIPKKPKPPTIITKVVKKPQPKNPNEIQINDDDDEEEDFFLDDEDENISDGANNEEFDFDQIAADED